MRVVEEVRDERPIALESPNQMLHSHVLSPFRRAAWGRFSHLLDEFVAIERDHDPGRGSRPVIDIPVRLSYPGRLDLARAVHLAPPSHRGGLRRFAADEMGP